MFNKKYDPNPQYDVLEADGHGYGKVFINEGPLRGATITYTDIKYDEAKDTLGYNYSCDNPVPESLNEEQFQELIQTILLSVLPEKS